MRWAVLRLSTTELGFTIAAGGAGALVGAALAPVATRRLGPGRPSSSRVSPWRWRVPHSARRRRAAARDDPADRRTAGGRCAAQRDADCPDQSAPEGPADPRARPRGGGVRDRPGAGRRRRRPARRRAGRMARPARNATAGRRRSRAHAGDRSRLTALACTWRRRNLGKLRLGLKLCDSRA